ncbi:hypothetical protein SRHO_G00219810 [Serrasalmus rhombeus]
MLFEGTGLTVTLETVVAKKTLQTRQKPHWGVNSQRLDVFLPSHLPACNNNEYLKVSREDMTEMLNKRGLLQDNSDLQKTQVPEGWRLPDAQTFNPHCRWASRSVLDPETFRFRGGAEIQLETVPPGLTAELLIRKRLKRCVLIWI